MSQFIFCLYQWLVVSQQHRSAVSWSFSVFFPQENKKEVPQVGVKGTKCCEELYQSIRPNSLSKQPPVQDQTRKQVKMVKENNEEYTLEQEHFG